MFVFIYSNTHAKTLQNHILINFQKQFLVHENQENHDSPWLTLKSWNANRQNENTEASNLIYLIVDQGNSYTGTHKNGGRRSGGVMLQI